MQLSKFSTIASLVALAATAFAGPEQRAMPNNTRFLGPQTYHTVEMRELAHPGFPYINIDLAREKGYEVGANGVLTAQGFAKLKQDLAIAIPVDGEPASAYDDRRVVVYVAGYGGIGLNGNLGDGRSATVLPDMRLKGGGRTDRVNPLSEKDHSSGAADTSEGFFESIRSNLMAAELPYGAMRTVAVITTGTISTRNNVTWGPRALIAGEDPLRWAHFVLNPHAKELGGQYYKDDVARVRAAMKGLARALPQPAGVDTSKMTEAQLFVSGLYEAIDRQAIQHSYAWAHRIFHGATSPSNATLDGRMIDFGTLTTFKGYPRVKLLGDDGFMGQKLLYKRDILENARDSWLQTLPPNLLAVLPSQEEMNQRFDRTFDSNQEYEMVRLAGAMDSLIPELRGHAPFAKLGEQLVVLAHAGNDHKFFLWESKYRAYHAGDYNIQKILVALARANLNSQKDLGEAVRELIPQAKVRRALVKTYQAVFKAQREIAARHGVSSEGEARYRLEAAKIRNRPMDDLFSSVPFAEKIDAVVADFVKTGDASKSQAFIEDTINESRRDFRDGEPYTLVISETRGENGSRVRTVFDARTNEKTQQVVGFGEPMSCQALF